MKNYRCRFCREPLTEVLDIGPQPLANRLVTKRYRHTLYPLILFTCEACGLSQVPDCGAKIFTCEYPYHSSVNAPYVEQCRKWVEGLHLKKDAAICEIACNDGYLLKSLREAGFTNLWGIEPVRHLAEKARKFAKVDNTYFCEAYAAHPEKQDLIIANNVLAHVPDLLGFLKGIYGLLKSDGFVSFEVPNFENLVRDLLYDTIYHEHYFYFTPNSITRVLDEVGLKPVSIERISSHGGSLRVLACRGRQTSLNLCWEIGEFRTRSFASKRLCLEKLYCKSRIAAFGAAAKGITFINYLGLKRDLIPYCVDETRYKVGKFLPGSMIPIVSVDFLYEDLPEYLLVLPWNFADSIVDKLKQYRLRGGRILFRKAGAMCELPPLEN